jgi:hypothetical protein
MAHVGKNWKLWFRRDAAWDLKNYKTGFAEAYEAHPRYLISSSRYATSLFSTVLAVNTSKDYSRFWRSETVGGFFDNVYWTFELLTPPNEVAAWVRFKIWHDALIPTPLFSADYDCPILNQGWDVWFLRDLRQLNFLSPDINVDPNTWQVTIRAAPWIRYNP